MVPLSCTMQSRECHSDNPSFEETHELWEEIINDPNQKRAGSARLFLESRARFAQAEERLVREIASVEEQWGDSIQTIFEIARQIHERQADRVLELDGYNRSILLENHHREKEFARRLVEAQERKTNYFSALMSKVTTKAKSVFGGKGGATKKSK
jgi:hypothetical protein